MKPMVCKTPRESAWARGRKGNRGSTPEIARVGSALMEEREKERGGGESAAGENREAECVVINEFRAGESAA